MQVDRIRLPAGETFEACGPGVFGESPCEIFLHPLIGRGKVNGQPFGGRINVFHKSPGGILLREPFTVRAETDLDFLVAKHPTSSPTTFMHIQSKKHWIGKDSLRREVREVLGFGGPSKHLRCGETINVLGGWSSYPPHRFDKDKSEARDFQEVFYIFTDPKDGYAIMRRNGELVELHSGDKVDVPLGEHPIVAGPGVRLFYAWFFVGADKLYPRWAEDMGAYA
jgi:5-deoxy-glucuronate isomerase